jgi:hypothetical protein
MTVASDQILRLESIVWLCRTFPDDILTEVYKIFVVFRSGITESDPIQLIRSRSNPLRSVTSIHY